MNQKHQAKVEKRNAKQEKQAQMVIWGIIIGLIVLALAFVVTYSMSAEPYYLRSHFPRRWYH